MAEVLHDFPCAGCGLLCDNLRLTVGEDRVERVEHACGTGEAWLLTQRASPPHAPFQVAGRETPFEQAATAAAALLANSRAPLIFGPASGALPGAREAVRLAERLGATLDLGGQRAAAPAAAVQHAGVSSCTLGEVRQRADLVIFLGTGWNNPLGQLWNRVIEPPGRFAPEGRRGRRVVVIDHEPSPLAERADQFLPLPAGGEFEFLWQLRGVVRGAPRRSAAPKSIAPLAEELLSCRMGVVFHGPHLRLGPAPHAVLEALFELVNTVNERTRCYTIASPAAGPGSAAAVLTWQTGFPSALDFTRGYPRYLPGEAHANPLLERGEVDAALVLGGAAAEQLKPEARRRLEKIPLVVLDPANDVSSAPAAVRFQTAVGGVHRGAAAQRLDGVMLPLRPLFPPTADTLPTDAEVLAALSARLPQFPGE